MVLNRPFRCPTRVYGNADYTAAVGTLVAGRPWALATSAGWITRDAVKNLTRASGHPIAVIDSIPQNPKVSDVLKLAEILPDEAEIVVALGGGSVIDCTKAVVGFCALGRDRAQMMGHLHDGAALPSTFSPRPIIAVPTTSGTGSEVTQWATVWGDDQVKFSFTHPSLFPTDAILDASLCVSMPPSVTLASGLDALSHALESIWNRNHTPLSDQLARSAIQLLKTHLPRTMAMPGDVDARREVQNAALLSGLAMGTTQTALAHSISYPFTARFGMPHGFACSFTLSEVARFNAVVEPARVALAAAAFGSSPDDFPAELAEWLDGLGIGAFLDGYVSPEIVETLGDNLITRARAANNVRDADGAAARQIARKSLDRFCRAHRASR